MNSWHTEALPNVDLRMSGDLSSIPEDQNDDTKRSHFDQFFKFCIDEDNTEEFVLRIKRRSNAAPGHTIVAVKVEGGLTEQPDGSVVFDGGCNENGVSKFGLSFEIKHEAKEEEPEEEPEEKEIKFFDHPEHKLRLLTEYEYTSRYTDEEKCIACTKRIVGSRVRWVYACTESRCYYGAVHSACGQQATTIRHPSHPKHALKLSLIERHWYRSCNVCKTDIECGLYYNCAKCDFDMHPLCPELPQQEDSSEVQEQEDDGGAAVEASDESGDPLTSAQALLNSQTLMMQQQFNNQMALNMARQNANAMMSMGRSFANF